MTFIPHFQTSQEKRSTKGLLSFHRVADDAVIRVYDAAGNVIETYEHTGDFEASGKDCGPGRRALKVTVGWELQLYMATYVACVRANFSEPSP